MNWPTLACRQTTALFATVLVTLVAAGCTSVPFDHPRSDSYAVESSDSTRLGKGLAEWKASHPGQSGFYPLHFGNDALGARLRLIERADHGIDAQYFLIKGDHAGSLFTGKLLRAADRGVRVRFLVDDIFTTGLDPDLSLLNSHPNIEVRLFNPVSRKGFQSLNFLIDFKRANRRMHNKSFTVDNQVTIVGGRNIADEYFQVNADVEFADFELLGFGPVAPMVSETFDLFWNSARAVPMEAFGRKVTEADLDRIRWEMVQEIQEAADGVYATAVNSPFLDDLIQGGIEPIVAPVTVVTDHPEKIENPIGDEHRILVSELSRLIEEAEKELIIVTPYFVPRKTGVEFLQAIRAKGVRVVVITNSLASTNHVIVHSGYAPYRRALLEAGVELYEAKVNSLANRGAAAPASTERLTLHTKAFVVDREVLFVGSLNVDPRSIDINTEMGLFLHSVEAASEFARQIDDDLSPYTYRLVLDKDGRIEWRYEGRSQVVTYNREPDTGFWRRFRAAIYRLLPIENQL
jgi:putative cardiolipin synthase